MAYQTGLLKARGRRKGQNRFWPVAAGQRQKLAGCSAYVCCVVLCVHERARTRARTPSGSKAGQKERPALHLCVCCRAVSPTPSSFLTWCNHSMGVCSSHAAASK